MSDHGTPAQVRPGFIVRIKLSSSMCYASARISREAAEALARGVLMSVQPGLPTSLRVGENDDFIEFPAADYERLLVRSSQVRAVEVRAVAADGGVYAQGGLVRPFSDDVEFFHEVQR